LRTCHAFGRRRYRRIEAHAGPASRSLSSTSPATKRCRSRWRCRMPQPTRT